MARDRKVAKTLAERPLRPLSNTQETSAVVTCVVVKLYVEKCLRFSIYLVSPKSLIFYHIAKYRQRRDIPMARIVAGHPLPPLLESAKISLVVMWVVEHNAFDFVCILYVWGISTKPPGKNRRN